MSLVHRSTSMITLLLMVGCASTGAGSGRSSRGILTQADLLETSEANLFEAIQRLRPQWLRARGSNFEGRARAPTVFLDGSRRGEVDFLQQIDVSDVLDVRFLSSADAATIYGTTTGTGGAIQVRTR